MNELCNPRSNQPPASPRTSPLTYSPPPPTPHREITAAVEVDFGAGPYERVEIRYGEDPVKLARQFCADKGFSQTIMMPLAVKLAQALDKAKRQAADIAKTGPKVAHGKINSARQKAKAEEARRQKEEMASKLFKRLDQNGDGDVSIAELQEALLKSSETVRMLGLTSIIVFDPKTDKMVVQRDALTEFLRRWDGDGNGVLSKAEFSRMFQLKDKPKGKKYSAFSSTNYREYDRDKMEEEEARQLQRERFALRKYGKDGLILDDWVRHVTSKPKKFVFGAGPGKRKEFEEDIQKLREKNKEKYPDDELQPPGQVFDKLYTKAMEKKERERTIEKQKEESEVMAAQAAKNTRKSVMSKVSRELMRNRTAGEYSSYNERLYAEASQRMEARKENSRRAREERERDELKEVTMQPEISAYAKHLKRPEAAWEKLGDGSKVREKYGKLAEIKMEMEKKELRDCTFRPKINAKSKEMMRGRLDNLRDRGLNHHDQLYFDANRRQMRQEEYEAWKASEHTFYPNAHRVVEEAGEGGVDAENDFQNPSPFNAPTVNHDRVVQRLQASAVRSEQHRERLADEMYGKLGKPQTGRAPQFPRNPANMPIHDLLYANRSEFDDKRELLRMRDDERLKEEASAVLKSERSRDLAAALKRRKLRRMFRALADGRGALNLGSLVQTPGWERALLNAGGASSPGANGKHGELSREHSVDSVSPAAGGSHSGFAKNNGTRDEVSEHDLKQMKEDVEAASAKLGDAPVDADKFVEAMEVHLAKSRTGPRAYLAPKSGYRAVKAERAVAAAELAEKKGMDDAKTGVSLERTKKLAEARQRKLGWDHNTPYYEKLIAEGERSKQKLEQLAAEVEAEQMSKYTFQPETLKFKSPHAPVTHRPRSAMARSDASNTSHGSRSDPMRPPTQERTGEERYADLERELEAVLALGEGGGGGGGNAEDLLAALGDQMSSPARGGRLPDLESSDSEEEE